MEFVYPKAHFCAKFKKTRFLQVTGALLLAIFTFVSFSAVCPLKAHAAQATLAWNASSNAIGYKVYYGTASGNYSQNIDVGNATNYTVSSLIDGQIYYFAAKAYDSTGTLSSYSNEVSKTVSSTVPSTYTITATASSNGTITAVSNSNVTTSSSGTSVTSTVTVSSGASQSFSITPNSGYSVASLTVDGKSVGAVTTYTFSNVTANHTISATFTANTASSYTISATAGSNGTITPSGSTAVSSGASQSYTITPNIGYYVVSVVVDGNTVASNIPDGGYTYTFSNLSANHTISATFAIRSAHIVASAGSGGSISPTDVWIPYYTSQTVTITPNSGYRIADVQVDKISVGAVSSYTFSNVDANHTISATFAANTAGSYTITATAGSNGTITPSGYTAVSSGASQSYTITPNTGYYVVSVVVDGNTVASNIPDGGYTYTFSNLSANHTISATFAIRSAHIVASAGSGGSISPTDVWIPYYTSQTVTITPNSGYRIADVQVDGTSVGAVSSYTFSNVDANHTICATFTSGTASTYTINASAGSGGSISPSGIVSVAGGSSKNFTITPNKLYNVSNLLVDGVPMGAVTSFTFTRVTANHTVVAQFKHK